MSVAIIWHTCRFRTGISTALNRTQFINTSRKELSRHYRYQYQFTAKRSFHHNIPQFKNENGDEKGSSSPSSSSSSPTTTTNTVPGSGSTREFHNSADNQNIKSESAKFIKDIETQKKRLKELASSDANKAQSTNPNKDNKIKNDNENNKNTNNTNTNTVLEFLNEITESENYKNLKNELKKFNDNRISTTNEYQKSLSEKLAYNVKELKNSAIILSKLVNDITGYAKINELRQNIVDREGALKNLRKDIAAAKSEYESAINERSNSQKSINDLLERKNRWSQEDLERFTNLYRNDHNLEQKCIETANQVKLLESKEEDSHNQLIQSIMNRYHEEQVWSDKIRQFSTWGTIFIMCINLLLVFVVQLIFEPWKRSRLVNSFEGKVKDLFQQNDLTAQLDEIKLLLKENNIVPSSDSDITPSLSDSTGVIPVVSPEGDSNIDPNSIIRLVPMGLKFSSVKEWVMNIYHIIFKQPYNYMINNEAFTVTFDGFEFSAFILGSTVLGSLIGGLVASIL
ncbi:hypothetical protein BVG19_g618 [[Candida] boidinii]|nr:hypothetical protein BVG19_g618 [[Candida] boidinii]OWB51527.1 hypothetical protein B5S27_g3090 [[Candida] boidinii]